MPHHPWRELRRRTDVVVEWLRLPDGLLGITDGKRIWMDPRQRQAEKRVTLAHELEHIRRGHGMGCVSGAEERAVCVATARLLIPLDRLADALLWSFEPSDIADELWVDESTVRDRLDNLTAAEQAFVSALVEQKEQSA